jgi:tRNA dimethylallyltransferase
LDKNLITILGATATGKTRLAVALAFRLNGEILSADSRQVYRGMDIGTGKDLSDYQIEGKEIDYHLIDIADPGEEYNIFRYKKDFDIAISKIYNNNKTPILCGGSGLYIETALNINDLIEVPENIALRNILLDKSMAELIELLKTYRVLHNTTDITDKERCIRAIEIEDFKKLYNLNSTTKEQRNSIIFGIKYPRDMLRASITKRLDERLQSGMIEEVTSLIKEGISSESLIFYGLEYKWVTYYLMDKISYNEMREKLNISIHQFAKRQETWWRRMEKNGIQINWIEGILTEDEKLNYILSKLQ